MDQVLDTLTTTDPEFVRYFGDFAFDETVRAASIDAHDRFVVQLGAATAVGGPAVFRSVLSAALDGGADGADALTPVEVKEVVYQAVAYVGFARVADLLLLTNEELRARGVELPLPGQSTTTPETRLSVGRAKQTEIVGDRVDAMYDAAPDDAVHFQRFLSANCFGDHYTRTGLSVRLRELLTFAVLVALGGADGQVRGHVAANLHVGNTRADLLDVLTVLVPSVGYPRTLNGLAAVDEGAPAAS